MMSDSEVIMDEGSEATQHAMDGSPSIGVVTEENSLNVETVTESRKKTKNKPKQDEKRLREEDERKRVQRLVDDKLGVEDFICEVEKHPCLWNSGEEAYSNKQEKVKTWIAVISSFIPNFDELKNAEKDEIGK